MIESLGQEQSIIRYADTKTRLSMSEILASAIKPYFVFRNCFLFLAFIHMQCMSFILARRTRSNKLKSSAESRPGVLVVLQVESSVSKSIRLLSDSNIISRTALVYIFSSRLTRKGRHKRYSNAPGAIFLGGIKVSSFERLQRNSAHSVSGEILPMLTTLYLLQPVKTISHASHMCMHLLTEPPYFHSLNIQFTFQRFASNFSVQSLLSLELLWAPIHFHNGHFLAIYVQLAQHFSKRDPPYLSSALSRKRLHRVYSFASQFG